MTALTKPDIVRAIKGKNLPVIICGAGIVGKALLSVCEEEGIAVECFCDSSAKVAGTEFCGKRVLYTPELKSRYKDAALLISVAAIADVVPLLESQGFRNWYAGGLLLEGTDTSQRADGAPIDYARFAVENCVLCHRGYLNPGKLFLRSVDLIITERCSLRCRDCSNLMQYYEKPENCALGDLLRYIDAFFAAVDEVMDFRLIGGDVFMNREWPALVGRLAGESRARRVVLYTNATLVPDDKDLQCLGAPGCLVIVTDYGPLSKRLPFLLQALARNKIAHHVLKPGEWLDCAAIAPHGRGPAGNRELFRACCAKNMPTLSEGRIYRCPYAANAARLSAVPDFASDSVDLFPAAGAAGTGGVKASLREYLARKDYLETCDYCSGRPLSGPEVPPAVQIAVPRPYRRYGGKARRRGPGAKRKET